MAIGTLLARYSGAELALVPPGDAVCGHDGADILASLRQGVEIGDV